MVLQEYKPSLSIAEFIRTIRLVHYDYQADGALPSKAYPPRPEHCLSYYARDCETVEYQHSETKTGNLSTVLLGQQTEFTNRFVGNNFLLIQVVFKPGGLFRLTGIPSHHLTNQYIDAQTIFSQEIMSSYLSTRQFERQFKQRMGVSPGNNIALWWHQPKRYQSVRKRHRRTTKHI